MPIADAPVQNDKIEKTKKTILLYMRIEITMGAAGILFAIASILFVPEAYAVPWALLLSFVFLIFQVFFFMGIVVLALQYVGVWIMTTP